MAKDRLRPPITGIAGHGQAALVLGPVALAAAFLAAGPHGSVAADDRPPYLDPARPIDERIEDLLSRLTLEEKVSLVHANGKFRAGGVERLGVPHLWTADGRTASARRWASTRGARRLDERLRDRDAGRHRPRSTWDTELAELYGRTIGDEARARAASTSSSARPSTSSERRCAAGTTTTSARTRGSPAASRSAT
jgi:hypothetical protein